MFISDETRKALFITWAVFAVLSVFVIVTPFVVDRQTIINAVPVCASVKKYNRECPLCGMTRAFIYISDGNVQKAVAANKGSVFLYFGFFMNILLFAVKVFLIKLKKFDNKKEAVCR